MNQSLRSSRADLKLRRQALNQQELTLASEAAATNFWQSHFVQRKKNIAIYMATGGEIDCQTIIENAWLRKKRIFAPILYKNRLKFAPLKPGSELTLNRFGILEPVYKDSTLIPPQHLDIVVVPLLAFDKRMNRLGMGGGFYDRSFAFSKRRPKYRRPLLVGLAHSFQQVANLHAENWDVPLHVVITDKQIISKS